MDITTLKRLAGINEFKGYTEYQIDENPSITAAGIKQKDVFASLIKPIPLLSSLYFPYSLLLLSPL